MQSKNQGFRKNSINLSPQSSQIWYTSVDMLDIQFIRENPEKVRDGITKKGYDPKLVDKVLAIDVKRKELLQKVEELRRSRNETAKKRDATAGSKIKASLQKLEPELERLTRQFTTQAYQIPNLPHSDVPVGKGESENKVVKEGKPTEFEFTPLDHVKLGKNLDIIDFESGAKVAGSGFYYLKNDGVLLELALVRYGLDFLQKKGWDILITPDLAHEKFYIGTGYLPRGPEAQTYTIADSDLGLIATAEVTLAGLHSDEILEKLPKKYCGYSHCFRVESGSYGKYSKGLYRVHQFTKVEMFVYAEPSESEKIHEELLKIEEDFWKSLEIPYRVIKMCTGDLGAQAVRKFDLEAWMPGRGTWGEVTSTSNTTDYQARRLGIRYRKSGGTEYVHTLNGTLVATPRAIIAILENFQQKDGSVIIPKILQSYIGKDKIS